MKNKTTPDPSFQDEMHEVGKGTFTIAMYILAAVFVIGVAGSLYKIVFAPMLVAEKVMDPNNILFNYEYYFDQNEAFEAANRKIARAQEDTTTRGQFELKALLNNRDDIVADYNANSQKLNRNLFKSSNLPHTLVIPE